MYLSSSKKRLLLFLIKHPIVSLKFLFYRKKWNYIQRNKPRLSTTNNTHKQEISKFISRAYEVNQKNINYFDHHLCHNIAAYYCSPFFGEKAVTISLDGRGDDSSGKVYLFEGNRYEQKAISNSPTIEVNGLCEEVSLGNIYGLFTEALGFIRNSDEGKVEALAAYGKMVKSLFKILEESVIVKDLSLVVNVSNVKRFYDIEWFNQLISKNKKADIAATIQRFTEIIVTRLVLNVKRSLPKIDNLCLSGGLFANVIVNLKIFETKLFENIFVLPAMVDEGSCIGSAILGCLEVGQDVSWLSKTSMPYFGSSIPIKNIELQLQKDKEIKYKKVGNIWPILAAEFLNDNKIIGIVHGNAEFGPRALGNRSILANPTNIEVKNKLNANVKKRNEFQPFCPTVLEEDREQIFEDSFSNKHMTMAFRVRSNYQNLIPAAIHIDGTARPQFLEEEDNPMYFKLIKKFKELSGVGVVINTSFNLHGRTMIEKAEHAITDFKDCNLDYLFLEGYLIERI